MPNLPRINVHFMVYKLTTSSTLYPLNLTVSIFYHLLFFTLNFISKFFFTVYRLYKQLILCIFICFLFDLLKFLKSSLITILSYFCLNLSFFCVKLMELNFCKILICHQILNYFHFQFYLLWKLILNHYLIIYDNIYNIIYLLNKKIR